MIDVTITPLPAAPLFAAEIWSNPAVVAARVAASVGLSLPAMGRSASTPSLTLMRFEPTVWLAEGDLGGLAEAFAADGALTAIGGGIVRVRLFGPGWRRLLMEGGVFDAESPAFAQGCTAATIIDHVNIRLHVSGPLECTAYVPASYAHDMIEFWKAAADAPG